MDKCSQTHMFIKHNPFHQRLRRTSTLPS